VSKAQTELRSRHLTPQSTSQYPPSFAECGELISNNLLEPVWAYQHLGSIDFEVVKAWT